MPNEKPNPTTVKFPASTLDKLDQAAELMGLPKQELIRLCTAIGLEDLRKVQFDLARLVSDAARPELTASTSVVPFEPRTLPTEGNFGSSSRLPEMPRQWIDMIGGIAAGAPISGHLVQEPIEVSKSYDEDHYALRVFGRSMEPKVPDGSTIIVKRWAMERGTPKKGAIVVWSDGTGSSLKEFGYRKAKAGEEGDNMGNVPVLRSLNPEFPDVMVLDGGKIDAVLVEVL